MRLLEHPKGTITPDAIIFESTYSENIRQPTNEAIYRTKHSKIPLQAWNVVIDDAPGLIVDVAQQISHSLARDGACFAAQIIGNRKNFFERRVNQALDKGFILAFGRRKMLAITKESVKLDQALDLDVIVNTLSQTQIPPHTWVQTYPTYISGGSGGIITSGTAETGTSTAYPVHKHSAYCSDYGMYVAKPEVDHINFNYQRQCFEVRLKSGDVLDINLGLIDTAISLGTTV